MLNNFWMKNLVCTYQFDIEIAQVTAKFHNFSKLLYPFSIANYVFGTIPILGFSTENTCKMLTYVWFHKFIMGRRLGFKPKPPESGALTTELSGHWLMNPASPSMYTWRHQPTIFIRLIYSTKCNGEKMQLGTFSSEFSD